MINQSLEKLWCSRAYLLCASAIAMRRTCWGLSPGPRKGVRDKWSRATTAKRKKEPPEDSQSPGGILESHDLPTYRHVSCNNK